MTAFKSNRTIRHLSFYITLLLLGLYIASHLFYLSLFSFFSIDQTDVRLKHEIQHVELSLKTKGDSLIIADKREFSEEDFSVITENPFFLQIYDDERNVIFKSHNVDFYYPIPLTYSTSKDKFVFADIDLPSGKLRTCMTKITTKSGKYFVIQLSELNELFDKVIKKIVYFDLLTLPFVILFLFYIGNYLIRRSYKPIAEIIHTAEEISAKNLSRRLELEGDYDDEINRLKITLNNLFERLERQVREISNFTDNASHQLMTPLTALQAELDYILKKERTDKEYQETISLFREQTGRMINIVKTLLLLTHQDRIASESGRVFNLTALFNKEIIPLRRRHERIIFDIPKRVYIKGNPELISIVINNLIDNALKYSPESEKIYFTVKEEENKLKIICEDFGIGIKKEEIDKIFERFFRAEKTERMNVKGYGLGLSLVKTIVNTLGGKIIVETEREKGVKFIIELPAVIFE